MKLVAEILTGSLFYADVEEDATVQDLKNKIGNQENLPTDRLILMLDADNEHYLLDKDEVSLKTYGVQDGSHIYISFQPLNKQPQNNQSPNTPESPPSSPTFSTDSDSDEPPVTPMTTPMTPPPSATTSSDSEEE